MLILDISAGSRAVWFEKNYADAIYVDIREITKPSVVANAKILPFADDTFDLIVFDPPHTSTGPTSGLAVGHPTRNTNWPGYGIWSGEEIRAIIRECSKEANRVSKEHALMAFKWNDQSISLENVFGMMYSYWRLLFGHRICYRTNKGTSTYWAMLRRTKTERA